MRMLTIDLEDWFHLLEWWGSERVESWDDFESRLEPATERILELLERHRTRATFFCLGWIARRHGALIRRIHGLGHEIASHGDEHRPLTSMTPRTARDDLARSLDLLGDLVGEPIRSYRAPGFSLVPSTRWMLDVLVAAGIECDSSIFTGWHPHGGCRASLEGPGWLVWSDGRLRECPVAAARLAGVRIPFSGGGFFRVSPYVWSRGLFRRSAYSVAYFHPRDFDIGQPRARGLGPIRRLRTYAGIRTASRRFERLLEDFEFEDMRSAVMRIDWERAPRVRLDGRSAGPVGPAATVCGTAP